MAHPREKYFYLFGNAEDGSCTAVNALIVKAVRKSNTPVLNAYRANYRLLTNAIESVGVAGETAEALKRATTAKVFGGFIGLRNFHTGKELGHLDERGIPGVLFYMQQNPPLLGLKEDTSIKLVKLEQIDDAEGIVEEEVETLLTTSQSSEDKSKKVKDEKEKVSNDELRQKIDAQIQAGFIKTGQLTFDLVRKRMLWKDHQIPIDPLEYITAECMARNMRTFVDSEKALAFHQGIDSERTFTEEMIQNYLKRTAYVINRETNSKQPYVDRDERSYRLNWFTPRKVPLPKVLENGPMFVDFTNTKVWMDNTNIHLLETGFNFLKVLAENVGVAVVRKDIIERVWPEDPNPSSFFIVLNNLKRQFGDAKKTSDGLILHNKGSVQLVDKRSSNTEE